MTDNSNGYYSDTTWTTLESLGLTDYVAEDMYAGPTLTEAGGGGDYEADATGTNYKHKFVSFLPSYRMDVKSKGLLTLDSDATTVDMADYTTYSNYHPKANVRATDWWLYSGVDASAATDKVTFCAVDETVWGNQWDGPKSKGESGTLSGAEDAGYYPTTYQPRVKFEGGDYGNLVYGSHGNDVLIGGAGDDVIHGVGGSNKIYGVSGDNQLFGGNGG